MHIVRLTNATRLSVIVLFIAALLAPLLGVSAPVRAQSIVRVNFQSEGAPVPVSPARYLRDYGLAYDARTNSEASIPTGLPGDPSGFSYGWVVPGTNNPRNMVGQGRGRGAVADRRYDSLMHMQPTGATPGPAAWEIALANGFYDVTVAAGEPQLGNDNSAHSIRLEGQTVIDRFTTNETDRFRVTTARVNLTDGRLTIDAEGGTNTKILFVDILSVADPEQPYIAGVTPADNAVGIPRNAGITAEVFVPTGGIRAATINGDTVQLRRASDNALIPASVNTTAGGDAITLQPSDYLDPNTRYIFSVSDGVEAVGGKKFRPFSSSFTTGTSGGPGGGDDQIAFDMVGNVASEMQFSSLAIGPDNKLYAASLEGYIYRYNINANGTLSNRQRIDTVRGDGRGPRAIIGIAFDPAATANNLILWISHNGEFVLEGAPDWTGAVARLSGPNLENFQNYVINLPHSFKDHMSNSIAFGPDGKLYISIGSNSAMGHPDNAWGSRPERLLTAAVLRIDQTAITNPPLDAKTERAQNEQGGIYNPFAPNAPVTIYASGVRNAYDLVWHSNGELYLPTNGSAQGGNAPPIPSNLPASCANRINGQPYTGPSGRNGQFGIVAQRDFLYRVEQGGYYGHPNPTRCEWILNGGNPTNGTDPEEVTKYPVNTQPDPNYRGIAYDFDLHKSPNGAIEYKSNAFNGALKGWLIVTRYSQGKDLIALRPGGPNNDIVEARERIQGVNNSFVGNGPLDVIEDTRNGNLYVIQFMINNPSQIALLRPVGDEAPRIRTTAGPFIFTDPVSGGASPSQQVQIENIGQSPLTINSLGMIGADAGQFSVNAGGSLPFTIQPGETRTVNVAFTAASAGPKSALLRISSNAANASTLELVLRGLGTAGTGGTNEPSLQWILNTYEINVNVGDDNPATNIIHSNTATATGPLLGQEVAAQLFQRADNANPVTIEPIAVFGPTGSNPVVRFGWYTRNGEQVTQNQLFQVGNSPSSNGQRLAPALESGATLTFDPGTGSFGFYSTWPFFTNRNVFSEDALNTWETNPAPNRKHKVRIYPLRDSTGAVVENAYIVATEEHTEGFDYQDVVVIVRNVKPASAEPPPPVNNAPTANAGDDRTVDVGGSVTLQGSGSDPDQGDTLSYSWAQTGGTNVTLNNANTATPSFTAPNAPATLTFRLTVNDGRGGTATDDVVITVINSPINGLQITGPSTRIVGQQANFSASVTGGSNISYSWDFGDGDTATGASVSHTFEQEGAYVVVVTAQNGGPAITANLAVTVTNAAPTANAGNDVSVPVNANVTLNGSASSDPDGHTPLTFSWRQVSGGPVTLSGANTAQATFTAPNQPDTLEFELTVTDAFGKRSTDRVQVVVESANRPNTAPVASAGADVRVAVGSTVNLHGGASFDPDGDALSYAWSQVSGPVVSGAALQSAVTMDDMTLTFTAPSTAAALLFELTVTDAYGKSSADQVLVLVEPANRTNAAPTANAGADLRVPVGAQVRLDAGASSDNDGDLIGFSWSQVSGGAVALNNADAQASFLAPSSPATLTFEVTVTDAFGASAKDQVVVRVVATTSANNPPTANAGPDRRVPVSTPVTLDARSSSDPDGDALSFTWQQVSGPSVTLSNANSAVAQLAAPAEAATLVFEVTVTDAFGGNNSDRVEVRVGPVTGNRAPLASAGASRSVPLRSNVRLDASGSSDPDGDLLRYSWRQVSGPSVPMVGAQTARPAFMTTDSAATFVFEVTVTDAFGANTKAQVTIRTSAEPAPDAIKIYLPIMRR